MYTHIHLTEALVATSNISELGCTPGGGALGGNRIHFLRPCRDVLRMCMCISME